MRIALLGAGRIGAFHGATLAAHPRVSELLVADIEPATATALAQRLHARQVDLELALGSADAAVIAASTSAHAALIGRCLDAGIPTFCEKPVAAELAETVGIVERAEAEGAVLQIGFQRRFDRGYAEAKRLLDSGALGTLYCVRMAGHDPAPPHEEYIPTSGGIFRDLHIHDFDVLRWLSGREVREVYARGSVRGFPVFERYDDVDTSAALLTLEDGALVVLTGGRHDPRGYDIRMELFGSEDSIAIGLDARTPLRSVEPDVPPPDLPGYGGFLERFAEAYRAELHAFIAVAAGEAPNPCTPREGLEALRIALAADLSRREGRPVNVSEVG